MGRGFELCEVNFCKGGMAFEARSKCRELLTPGVLPSLTW